jgi:hypothetical protein
MRQLRAEVSWERIEPPKVRAIAELVDEGCCEKLMRVTGERLEKITLSKSRQKSDPKVGQSEDQGAALLWSVRELDARGIEDRRCNEKRGQTAPFRTIRGN